MVKKYDFLTTKANWCGDASIALRHRIDFNRFVFEKNECGNDWRMRRRFSRELSVNFVVFCLGRDGMGKGLGDKLEVLWNIEVEGRCFVIRETINSKARSEVANNRKVSTLVDGSSLLDRLVTWDSSGWSDQKVSSCFWEVCGRDWRCFEGSVGSKSFFDGLSTVTAAWTQLEMLLPVTRPPWRPPTLDKPLSVFRLLQITPS
jgi:hypothetical protein